MFRANPLLISLIKKKHPIHNIHKLMLLSVIRHESGIYTCTASNGVGEPAVQSFNVSVQCKLVKVVKLLFINHVTVI